MSSPTLLSRVFMNGNSQAVRIPQEFRLDASRVEIRRQANGDLVIHPLPEDRGEALLQALSGFDDEFIEALEEGQREQPPMQEREEL
ncbi:antitoxin [Pseudomonas citronellolis]|uniref:antitoxin n=1 Tax=Pseudomonas citronellolis TaxID=53408 RepID=UPI002D79DD7C|nr:AbrB/MazE/SpoVT family DNA-binding domain-containing protein [Pseudomonas citronellolis]WRT85529.1 AbrB/MazE/SpoVT family DNA-binding domain-containing protein [Pseudomonas citronellolis]